ncbi:hypothetical protein [Sphingomonas hylomeconis]|uniref:Uncharacterized protein n=1 Tax=Sphingomonas hylomeconis TaxID=1395958 RepID=A0ABV7ST85_9SPHN|nr:hypothetical protein [Sphingomonas hylomeconis]
MFDDDDSKTPADPIDLSSYAPVALQPRRDGWTAERQRTFLTALAETGSISLASSEAGISARSAYRLRARPEGAAFAAAWEQALRLAALRLVTIAYERAVRGTVHELWKNGDLVGETRTPSDKLLIFLLSRLLAGGAHGLLAGAGGAAVDPPAAAFPAALDRLVDSDVPLVPISSRDFYAQPPVHDPDPAAAPGDPDEDA